MMNPTFHIQSRFTGAEDWETPSGHFTTQQAAVRSLKMGDRPLGREYRVVCVQRTVTVVWSDDGVVPKMAPLRIHQPGARMKAAKISGTSTTGKMISNYDGAMMAAIAKRIVFFPMTLAKEKDLLRKGYVKVARARFPGWAREAEHQQDAKAQMKSNLSLDRSPKARS